MCETFDTWKSFQFNFPFKEQFQTCTAGHRRTEAKAFRHLICVSFISERNIYWCGNAHDLSADFINTTAILIITLLMTLFSQISVYSELISSADDFIEGWLDQSTLKRNILNVSDWNSRFVCDTKTQTKRDLIVQMIHKVSGCFFNWHFIYKLHIKLAFHWSSTWIIQLQYIKIVSKLLRDQKQEVNHTVNHIMHNSDKVTLTALWENRGSFPAQINVPLWLFFTTRWRARVTNEYNSERFILEPNKEEKSTKRPQLHSHY